MKQKIDPSKILSAIDNKTKPPGSLGLLEDIAFKVAKIQNTLTPTLEDPTILIFASDHGIAKKGVSAFPQEVTRQMVLNFLNGGAAINVFTKQHNIDLKVIDCGVIGSLKEYSHLPNFHIQKIAESTQDFSQLPAMSQEECMRAIELGKSAAVNHVSSNCNIIGFGEMGIGNTSSASLIMSTLLHIPIQECVGRGTGVTDQSLDLKKKVLQESQSLHFPDLSHDHNALDVLEKLGGFEIAQMVGALLASYEKNRILLIDGFIATASFLIAKSLNPNVINNAIFCHKSNEFAHNKILEFLDVYPVLDLGLRLGEGTGCAIAYPIIESAVRFLNDMASFDQAGVSNK